MEAREILHCIDRGANRYIHLFGMAEHMEVTQTAHYKVLKPKEGEYGICFVYDIDLDALTDTEQDEQIAQIKALGYPWWLDLCASDALFYKFFGKERVHGQTQFADNDEVYMAMLPEELPAQENENTEVVRVCTQEQFAAWAKVANDVLSGGMEDLHPVYHWPLCEHGLMECYTLYKETQVVAVAAIIVSEGSASLEFVATVPGKRRCGFATAVCDQAVRAAFENGAGIVTVRAIDAAAAKLYATLGFKVYNQWI